MRINEDFIDSIDSDSLQTSVDETKPRSYEDFEHRFDVVLTSMKYRLLGSDKFDMKYINMIILILKKAPYIPDFVIEVQNMTTIDYVDYDPLAGNYKEFADFHKTLNGEQVVYRFGFDMDKNTPFGWFILLIVKLLRLLNSTYSSKWTEPGLTTSDYRYNALMNAEYNSRCILPGDMKLDNPVNPAESLLVLHNCWREAEMPYVTVRDTNKILDSWQPVYKEDYGLLPLAFGRPTDAWWSLISYYHYVASRQKHSLIIGSYI